ncbi:hypothetical protein A1OK_10840 [Enterovibrio norvegicus FF-454]|uniref:Uncharacterized protein n=1 Tax=Enterovibrio norvegicus FF-454 TaxID=1185651 RepID=A0A1E5C4R2_9GAMM|nr:hypothetical protein [Enterovibrio norvegicus]OEE60439.1 hypothetical protein A1OK_10840 [Enterovibrio norvegicus FF-454]
MKNLNKEKNKEEPRQASPYSGISMRISEEIEVIFEVWMDGFTSWEIVIDKKYYNISEEEAKCILSAASNKELLFNHHHGLMSEDELIESMKEDKDLKDGKKNNRKTRQ